MQYCHFMQMLALADNYLSIAEKCKEGEDEKAIKAFAPLWGAAYVLFLTTDQITVLMDLAKMYHRAFKRGKVKNRLVPYDVGYDYYKRYFK